VDVDVDGGPTAFFPMSMALDGQGDLIVFSFSPKLLFEVTPTGHVSQLAPDYATALAPAPDGSVLVSERGTGIQQVSGTTVTTLLTFGPGSVSGLTNGLAPEGIAEGSNGTIYVDTEPGDGLSDQTGLFAITNGVARAVTITTPLAATLPALGASGYPAITYPLARPASAPELAMTSCPSTQGLVPFDKAATAAAHQLVGLWNTSFSYDLRASDRAWWPGAVATFTGGPYGGRQSTISTSPAKDDLYADAVAQACGGTLVNDSLAIVMGPSAYSTAVEHLFLLDRSGTPLVYFADY
jgi:hypothetical protein